MDLFWCDLVFSCFGGKKIVFGVDSILGAKNAMYNAQPNRIFAKNQ